MAEQDAGLDEQLRRAVDQWMRVDRNAATREWVQQRAAAGDAEALRAAFAGQMQFGTAGLRAKMGAGTARMNDLTVLQAAQGVVRYVREQHAAGKMPGKELRIVVGHDARHHSERWARLTACACAARGVECHLWRGPQPTPLVPFAVRRLRAAAGVVVTASHNPPQDNGYKVYWANGAQIVPPHDAGIAAAIDAEREPWGDAAWAAEGVLDHAMVRDPEPLRSAYVAAVEALRTDRAANAAPGCPRFVYTPVHGVGRAMVDRVLAAYGFRAPAVPPEQADPDPAFPTTPFPNPEERGVLDLAQGLAGATGAPVVLANDPDADRLCVAEREPGGAWRQLSGNELGALLGWWAWRNRPAGVAAGDCAMIASAVSSRFLASMAAREGFLFEDTLTGFKWMGSRAAELEEGAGKTVLFAFEEAIGYMHGRTGVWDKDGVSAAAVAAEMCRAVYAGGGTLASQLRDLMQQYGWHVQRDGYFLCEKPGVFARIFARLRGWGDGAAALPAAAPGGARYPGAAGGAAVVAVRDLTARFDSARPGGAPALPHPGAGSEMITFSFANGARVTLRTSGTEPKLKYYSELAGGESAAGAEAALRGVVSEVVDEWLRPQQNGLRPPRAAGGAPPPDAPPAKRAKPASPAQPSPPSSP